MIRIYHSKLQLISSWQTKIICVLLSLLLIQSAHAQQSSEPLTEKVSLSINRSDAASLLRTLQQQTSYTFTFDNKSLSNLPVQDVQFSNSPLAEVLKHLTNHYGLKFSVASNKNIGVLRTNAAAAVSNNGRIAGKIIDEENGDPIADVTIRIGNQGLSSAVDGSFQLTLPKGTYEAEVTAVGYGKKLITQIEVKENQTADLNITLKRERGQLSAVVVKASAKKESVASFFTRQKNNAAITDGISAEQISRTPDKNIGESLKRISGISSLDNKYVVVRGLSERYNQAILNGQPMPSTELNRKQFSFDIIPSNIVDNITVVKTLTPDMSAEFGGGLVQINTKGIPTENFLNVTVGASINSNTTGEKLLSLKRESNREYFGDYAAHRYVGGKKNWNSLEDIRALQAAQKGGTILQNNWQPYYYKAQPSQNYQVSLGRVFEINSARQQKVGFIASLSYRNTQQIQDLLSARYGFGSGTDEKHTSMLNGRQFMFNTNIGGVLGVGYSTPSFSISWQNLFTRLLDQQTNFGTGLHQATDNDTSTAFIERLFQTTLWQSQLRGEHRIGSKGIKLNWTINYAYAKKVRPDNHVLVWNPVPSNFDLPHNEFTMAGYYPEGNSMPADDPASLRMYTNTLEKNTGWDLNVQLPFQTGNVKTVIKPGYAGWVKDRRFFVAMMGDYPGDFTTYPSMGQLFSAQYGGGRSGVSNFGDDYNRTASLHATYAMFDHRWKKFRLVWGARAEYFDMNKVNGALDGIVKDINRARGGDNQLDFSELYNREDNWRFFPSANITYSLTSKINIRAAYAKSVIRPDLREMAWFREYDFELGGTYNAYFLHTTTLDNYDLRFEWYPGAGEVLSASVFYKNIKFPMEIRQVESQRTYELYNNYRSKSYGIEMEVRKSLQFIAVPVIKNLTVYGNFTALKSRVTPMNENLNRMDPANPLKVLPQIEVGKEEERPLTGQSNFMTNLGLYYDDKHLHLSLSYNSVSARPFIIVTRASTSEYDQPMKSLDAQIAYRFLKQKMEVKLNLTNLLDAYSVVYTNQGKNPQEYEEAKSGNYKSNYLQYQKNTDLLIQRLTPGRTYGLSISYQFSR